MDSHVQPQPLLYRKRLGAIVADERLAAAVLTCHMVLQTTRLAEAHSTVAASKRSFVRMDAQMLPQVVAVREALRTDGAHMVATRLRRLDAIAWDFATG